MTVIYDFFLIASESHMRVESTCCEGEVMWDSPVVRERSQMTVKRDTSLYVRSICYEGRSYMTVI